MDTYYSLLDISAFTDCDIEKLRFKISGHFIGKADFKRGESVLAKAFLCYLLNKKSGLTEFSVDNDENGKPYLRDADVHFNLSHSGKYVLCAVSENRIGCDIQEVKPFNEKVAKRFFTKEEHRCLLKSENKALDFTRLWVLKESILKYTGEGISGGLDRFDFSEYYKQDRFCFKSLYFKIFEIPGYVVSICSESENVSLVNVCFKDVLKQLCR